MTLRESILDNISSTSGRLIPSGEDVLVKPSDYLIIMANTIHNGSMLKDDASDGLLEETLVAFGVQAKVMSMERDEYKEMSDIDHGGDYRFISMCDGVTCIFFDYPDTVRDQVKFVIRMMADYWNSYWGYSDIYLYKFDSVQYVPMYDRWRMLVAAAHDIAGLNFWLKHCDHKRSFQYEGKEFGKLKQTIAALLPDNSDVTRPLVSSYIDQMLRIRKRRLKNYKRSADETGANIKWRPVHESVLDDISRSDTKRPLSPDVQPTNASLTNYRYMFAFCGIGPNDVEPITERICEIMGVDVQVRAWTMDEFREQKDYIAQTNNTDFETEFLVCVFIKDFPSSTYGKVKFMIRMYSSLMHDYDLLMDVLKYTNRNGKFEFEIAKVNTLRYAFYFDGYLQRLKYGTSVEKNAVSYTAEQLRGNIIPLMYDNVSIYDQSHNDEVDAVLDKMVERAVHGDQALLESVLDDISRSDMNQHDYSNVQSDTQDIFSYYKMFMFGSGKNISQKELESSAVYDIADIMDVDICMKVYTKSELEDNPLFDHRDAQDVTPMVDCNICLFSNWFGSLHESVLFFSRVILALHREFNVWPDVRVYTREYYYGAQKFEYENVAGAACSTIYHFFQENGNISQGSLNTLISNIVTFTGCSFGKSYKEIEFLKNTLFEKKRPGQKLVSPLDESVLDDIDRSVVKREDIISDRPDALNYDTLFLFNTDCEVEDTSRIELLGEAMGIDLRVEQYTRENFRELLWIEHSRKTDDTFETDHIVCIFVNLPDSDYQKAKFLFLLMRVMPNVYHVMWMSAWTFENKSGDMFQFTIMVNHVIDNVDSLFGQNILNAKNNQTMDMMSFRPAIFSYQDICSLLGFWTPEKKLQVERAMKNLLKCPRYARKSAKLHESVLDNLEKTEVQIPQSQEDVRFTDYNMVYVIPIASGSEDADTSGIIQICQRFKVDVHIKVWTRQEFREVSQIEQHKTTFFDGTHVLCIFIDKLPDGIGNRVRFLTRILLQISREYDSAATVYRYDYRGGRELRFEYRTTGVSAIQFNDEFFATVRDVIQKEKDGRTIRKVFHWEDRDDAFQIAEIATLVNTYDKTIYSEVSTALDAIGNQLLRNYYESAKLHESILDNVERTSADSAASLADSPASPDTEIDKYVRFKQMFLFQAEKHIRPGILSHLLDVLNVDYEILNINQRELKQIDGWIDDSQFKKLESFNLVLLFINLPDKMYDRAVLMMRIMSAFCQEYGMFQNTVFRCQLEDCPYYYDKWFVCRSISEQVVQQTAHLNNYYNGGNVYEKYSDIAVDNFINNWRIQFARLMSYGYNLHQALQHMYMVTARLNKRRMTLQDRRTST